MLSLGCASSTTIVVDVLSSTNSIHPLHSFVTVRLHTRPRHAVCG
jgi:hypothetical protein